MAQIFSLSEQAVALLNIVFLPLSSQQNLGNLKLSYDNLFFSLIIGTDILPWTQLPTNFNIRISVTILLKIVFYSLEKTHDHIWASQQTYDIGNYEALRDYIIWWSKAIKWSSWDRPSDFKSSDLSTLPRHQYAVEDCGGGGGSWGQYQTPKPELFSQN